MSASSVENSVSQGQAPAAKTAHSPAIDPRLLTLSRDAAGRVAAADSPSTTIPESSSAPQATFPLAPADPLRLRGHVPVLDGLRGLAIGLVLLRHFTPLGDGQSFIGTLVKGIAKVGGFGVDLFFVLSGFLITGILLSSKDGPRYFRNFLARRAVRIFPLYYGVLIVVFVLLPLFHRASSPEFQTLQQRQGWLWVYGTNIFTSMSTDERSFSAGWVQMDHFWSLAVEEHFYLFWPLIVFLLPRRGLIAACIALVAIALATRLGYFLKQSDTMAFYTLTPCRADALAIGGLIAILARSPSASAFVKKLAAPLLLIAIAILAATWNADLQVFVLCGTLMALLMGALMILVLTRSPGHPLRLALDNPIMRTLGKYSYAIYVLHPFLQSVMNEHLSYQRLAGWTHSGVAGTFCFLAIGLAGSVALGWVSWHLYEKHFLKLKRFFEYQEKAPEQSRSTGILPV